MVNQGIQYLNDLNWFLQAINQDFYTQKPTHFTFKSTIGSHCRHVIEFYTQFLNFYNTLEVNYDDRPRDLAIETDLNTAIQKIEAIQNLLNNADFVFDKPLNLINNNGLTLTTIGREINYLAEHTVHHLALIRLMAEVLNFNFSEMNNFGIAHSTQVAQTGL